MRRIAISTLALVLGLGASPAFSGDGKVSRERLDAIMSAWPDDVRENAEHLIAAYGMPDRVTSTILVWDVPSAAQQAAMVRAAGERVTTAEAGAEMISVKK